MKELIGLNSQILEVNFGDHSLRADGLWYWYSNWSCYFSSSSVIRQKDGKKHAKFSEKTNIFYPLIRTSICVCMYYRIKFFKFSINQILDFLITWATFGTKHWSNACSRVKQVFLNFLVRIFYYQTVKYWWM